MFLLPRVIEEDPSAFLLHYIQGTRNCNIFIILATSLEWTEIPSPAPHQKALADNFPPQIHLQIHLFDQEEEITL